MRCSHSECELSGGYSKYQKILTVVLLFPQIPTALIVLSPIFTGTSNVPLLCPDGQESSTDTCTAALNCTNNSDGFEFVSIVQEVGIRSLENCTAIINTETKFR